MKKIILLMAFFMAFATPAAWADPGGVAPFQGAFNYCVEEGTSVADARADCEDAWFALCGWDVAPPVTVTHCPNRNTDNNGKKDLFTPNGFCGLVECGEGFVELNCHVKSDELCAF